MIWIMQLSKILYEELYKAINMLTDTQKRRIKLYYFEDKTLKEISEWNIVQQVL